MKVFGSNSDNMIVLMPFPLKNNFNVKGNDWENAYKIDIKKIFCEF